jgi:hypothetical protein
VSLQKEAQRVGEGVDGKMIDVPVIKRAGLLLEREAAISAREAKKPRIGS